LNIIDYKTYQGYQVKEATFRSTTLQHFFDSQSVGGKGHPAPKWLRTNTHVFFDNQILHKKPKILGLGLGMRKKLFPFQTNRSNCDSCDPPTPKMKGDQISPSLNTLRMRYQIAQRSDS